MKKTKLLALILAFLMLVTSVGVFAEENTQEEIQISYQLSAEAVSLRDNIAQVLADVEDGWSAFDMSLYQKIPDAVVSMSDEMKQTIIDSCIDKAVSDGVTASDLAKSEIVLRSLGVDSSELCTSDGESISNAELLFNADHTASGHYSVPWIFLADLQGNLNLTDEQKNSLIEVLQQNSAGGTFGYEWDGVQYPDPDTGAVVLAALAPMYNTNDNAKSLCDEIFAAFESIISESGSFGSANSDAFVIIGLLAMGENPYEFCHETSGKSVVDGLLSSVNETNNGFTFWGADNFMATEQGFRALVALSLYEGEALNIYDFSDAEVVSGRHSEAPEDTTEPEVPDEPITPEVPEVPEVPVVPDEPEEEGDTSGSIFGGGGNTIGGGSYRPSKPKEPSEPKEEPEKEPEKEPEEKPEEKPTPEFSDTDNHWAKDGIDYVTSLGIMNGVAEGIFAPEEKLTRGMLVTMLYRLSGDEAVGANEFSDVAEDAWFADSAVWAKENGIASGYGDGTFGANDEVTREQLVVFLMRYAELKGINTEAEKTEFKDSNAVSDWAQEAINWAKENGIVSGRDDGIFDPKGNATRGEIAVVFMRFCEMSR